MHPIIVPVLTALIGVAMCGIAFAELLAQLRWQERQLRADRSSLAGGGCVGWSRMAACPSGRGS